MLQTSLTQNDDPFQSFQTQQLPNLTFKKPFKHSREAKSYVSLKEIAEATSQPPRVGLLDLARGILRNKDEPTGILTNRLASYFYKRRINKENNKQQPTSSIINRKPFIIKDKSKRLNRKRYSELTQTENTDDQNIVLKICRLKLHDNNQTFQSIPTQRISSRAGVKTSRTSNRPNLMSTRQSYKHRREFESGNGRLSAWQINNFDDDF